jgi:hypothetical protein
MQSSSCDFPASTSPGSSPRPSKVILQQQQKAINHCPSNYCCDNKTRSENQSDLCRHLQSFSAGSHLCPFDVHKFRKVEMKEQVKSLHVVLSKSRSGILRKRLLTFVCQVQIGEAWRRQAMINSARRLPFKKELRYFGQSTSEVVRVSMNRTIMMSPATTLLTPALLLKMTPTTRPNQTTS